MDSLLLKVLRRVKDIDGLVDSIVTYTYNLYGKEKLKRLGFNNFSDTVIHYLWIDEISPIFEEYDDETESIDITISRMDVHDLKEKLKLAFNDKLLKFYNEKIDIGLEENLNRIKKLLIS